MTAIGKPVLMELRVHDRKSQTRAERALLREKRIAERPAAGEDAVPSDSENGEGAAVVAAVKPSKPAPGKKANVVAIPIPGPDLSAAAASAALAAAGAGKPTARGKKAALAAAVAAAALAEPFPPSALPSGSKPSAHKHKKAVREAEDTAGAEPAKPALPAKAKKEKESKDSVAAAPVPPEDDADPSTWRVCWVGRLDPTVTLAALREEGSKFGKVIGVFVRSNTHKHHIVSHGPCKANVGLSVMSWCCALLCFL